MIRTRVGYSGGTQPGPTSQSSTTQYRVIVFHHDDEQRRLTEETRAALEESSGETILTDIRPAGPFYRAEADHQKHALRGHGYLLGELTAIYPDDDDLTDSTAAARINGFLGGEGTAETLQAEIDDYGLSPGGREALLAYVDDRLGGCPD